MIAGVVRAMARFSRLAEPKGLGVKRTVLTSGFLAIDNFLQGVLFMRLLLFFAALFCTQRSFAAADQVPENVRTYIESWKAEPKAQAAMRQLTRAILLSHDAKNEADAGIAEKMRFDAGFCLADRLTPVKASEVSKAIRAMLLSTSEALKRESAFRSKSPPTVVSLPPAGSSCVEK